MTKKMLIFIDYLEEGRTATDEILSRPTEMIGLLKEKLFHNLKAPQRKL